MTKKNEPYYAEIRITGFCNKRALVDALQDAVTAISDYRPPEGDIEVSLEKFDAQPKPKGTWSWDNHWVAIKIPKRLRKVIEHCFGSVKL